MPRSNLQRQCVSPRGLEGSHQATRRPRVPDGVRREHGEGRIEIAATDSLSNSSSRRLQVGGRGLLRHHPASIPQRWCFVSGALRDVPAETLAAGTSHVMSAPSGHHEAKPCVLGFVGCVVEPNSHERCGFAGAVRALSVGHTGKHRLWGGARERDDRSLKLALFGFPGEQQAVEAGRRVRDRNQARGVWAKARVFADLSPRERPPLAQGDVSRVAFSLCVEVRRPTRSEDTQEDLQAGSEA